MYNKPVVCIAEMARMVGLSRQRFHQLLREGVFPPPVYDIHTRRPHYPEEIQRVVQEVREKNVGINGRVVLFYTRTPGKPKQPPKPKPLKHTGLIEGLKGLGLVATEQEVAAAVTKLHPNGTSGVGEGQLLRGIFVELMRRDRKENDR